MKYYGKLICVALVVLMIGTTVLIAGDKNRIGTAGGLELLVPVGARSLALGGSVIASATGAEAIFWNPAGVARATTSFDFTFTNYSYFAGINTNYGAAAFKLGSVGTFGFSVKSVNFGDIPYTSEDFPDGTGATFSPSFTTIGLTYSTYLIDRVAVGVTAHYITESIMSTNASALAASFGIQYVGLGVQGLNLGIAVRNVGSALTYSGSNLYQPVQFVNNTDRPQELLAHQAANNELPTTFELGASYAYKFDDQNSLSFAGNFVNNNFYVDEYKLGMEYSFDEMIFARGSYSLSPTADKDALNQTSYLFTYTFGAGFHTNVEGVSMSVDYAYQQMKYFGANNMFTLSFGF